MSLKPKEISDIPEETRRIAERTFPKGNIYMQMRDELGVLYEDAEFASLFPSRGQPAYSPWRLALVCIMQYVANLSDRQAAEAVRARIDWKYALSLEIDDPGFDYSVLSEFRTRLLDGGMEQHILDAMLTRFEEYGLLKHRGRQRTDSTHIMAAVREPNRIESIGETLRAALNSLAVAAAELLVEVMDDYGVELIGPVRPDVSWQAREGGYVVDDFQLDWESKKAICPQGAERSIWESSSLHKISSSQV